MSSQQSSGWWLNLGAKNTGILVSMWVGRDIHSVLDRRSYIPRPMTWEFSGEDASTGYSTCGKGMVPFHKGGQIPLLHLGEGPQRVMFFSVLPCCLLFPFGCLRPRRTVCLLEKRTSSDVMSYVRSEACRTRHNRAPPARPKKASWISPQHVRDTNKHSRWLRLLPRPMLLLPRLWLLPWLSLRRVPMLLPWLTAVVLMLPSWWTRGCGPGGCPGEYCGRGRTGRRGADALPNTVTL